jgi:DNA-binding winged helix-turn-helix (wHTH) protein
VRPCPASCSRKAAAGLIYAFAGYELDTERYELRCDGVSRHVEPQVFDVLAYLISHRGRVVSKDELLAQVWGHSFVSEATLSSRLKAARRAIGDSGQVQALIRTVRGRGYQFVGEIEDGDGGTARGGAPIGAGGEPAGITGREVELARLAELLGGSIKAAPSNRGSSLGIGRSADEPGCPGMVRRDAGSCSWSGLRPSPLAPACRFFAIPAVRAPASPATPQP